MSKLLLCADVVPGCEAEVRAETDEEILRQAAEHVRAVHGIDRIDEGLRAKVVAAIRTEG